MTKLLSILLAGLFATGAIAQTSSSTTTSPSGMTSGSSSVSTPSAASGASAAASGTLHIGTSNGPLAAASAASSAASANRSMGIGPRECPPGLEKKDNGCLPPGQAKKITP
jgi:hypothetical protein